MDYFSEEPFFYTLQPPLLGDNPMDEFLFQTRRGFCEHYAYAFVMMMRAAGVPARIVAGYMGGEVNPVNRTVIVHQFDAHAWAEVWLDGQGWVRVDPTAAVAPDRIELGLEEAVAGEGSFLSIVTAVTAALPGYQLAEQCPLALRRTDVPVAGMGGELQQRPAVQVVE